MQTIYIIRKYIPTTQAAKKLLEYVSLRTFSIFLKIIWLKHERILIKYSLKADFLVSGVSESAVALD